MVRATLGPVRAAITGATGLLGSNLAAALLEDGHQVVATRRGTATARHLAALPIEWRAADLGDPDALARAFEGAEVVFHCAATVEIAPRVTPLLHQGNVVGTDHVLEAVRRAGARRMVHCSSVVAAAVSEGDRDVTEEDAWNFPEHGLDDGYAITKRQSEERVLAAARDGLDAVVVQPCYMLGPYDARPSSGQLVVELAHRRIPLATPGSQNIVDVRDVARGMILAAERGRRAERYILGGENLSYAEVFRTIAGELGVPPPARTAPEGLVLAFGAAVELGAWLVRRPAILSRSTVRYAYCTGYRFSSGKAERELGYVHRPAIEAIRASIAWLRAQGMLPVR